jgi:hypothetical protein
MHRIFFHNRHDKNSKTELDALPEGVQVIDVFGGDNIPDSIRVSRLPYLIDKQIVLDSVSPSPPVVGDISLQFNCLDYEDQLITDESGCFAVTIDYGTGVQAVDSYAESGALSLELNCPIEKTITIRIEKDGYLPFEYVLEVVESG